MAIFTIEELDEQIKAYKEALKTLAISQSYKHGNREFVRADLPEIRKTLSFLDQERSNLLYGSAPKIMTGRISRK